MRPIYLEIEGLNSFEDKQSINFEKLTEYGIFGIFGKTGSGKSTILDAVTLALYGNIVRLESKNAQGIEELLNVNSDKIYVKFDFELSNDRYSIERIYKRKNKKDEKEKTEIGKKDARLIINKDEIYDKTTDIKNKINEIIGLSLEDFTRSVVLPQGKFSEFLKLSGMERRDMLERIFSLEKYGKNLNISINIEKNKLKSKINEYNAKISVNEDINEEKINYYNKVCDEKSNEKNIIFEEIEKFEKEYKYNENIYIKTKKLYEYESKFYELSKKEKEYKIKEENYEKAKKSLEIKKISNIYMEKQKLKNEYIQKKDEVDMKYLKIEKEYNDLKEKIEKIEEEQLIKKEMYKKLKKENLNNDKLKMIKIKIDNYKNYKKDIKNETNILNEMKIRINQLNNDKLNIKNKLEEIENNIENKNKIDINIIDNSKKIYYDMEYNYKETLRQELEIDKILKIIENNKINRKSINEKITKFEKDISEFEVESKKDIINIISKDLKEGKECPVCGSIHHPKLKNQYDSEIYIENELNDILNKKENIKKELNSLYVEIQKYDNSKNENDLNEIFIQKGEKNSIEIKYNMEKLKKDIEKMENEKKEIELKEEKRIEELKENEKKLFVIETELSKLNGIFDEKSKKINELFEKISEIEDYIIKEEKKYFINNKIDEDKIDEDIEEMQKTEKNQNELEKDIEKNELNIEKNKKIFFELKENLNLIKIEQQKYIMMLEQNEIYMKEKMNEIDEKVTELGFKSKDEVKEYYLNPEKMEILENDIKNYKEEIIKIKSLIESINNEIKNERITEEEWLNLNNKKENLNNKKESIIKELERILTEKKNIENILNEKKFFIVEKEKWTKKYDIIEELSKLFSGNRFVEYLAISKLRKISIEATERLLKMTNGRYKLMLDKTGEFLIQDNFNGGLSRKVNTLSGGETFLASLSLALALSKHIQLKGKVKLEFFFLDEGFGTLDSELLDKVMSALEKLSMEKVKVGLITHVEELKDRIPAKIEVKEAISGERGTIIL